VPVSDSCLDPLVLTDWLHEMDHFFEWYNLPEDRRVKFAKMKLISRAELLWQSIKQLLARKNQPPILYWEEMRQNSRKNTYPNSTKISF
jgi:hypothetical protein